MMTRANKMVLWRDLTLSRVRIKHLAGDPARGAGGGEAGVVVGQSAGQQLAQDMETMFTHIRHAVQVRTAAVMVARWP